MMGTQQPRFREKFKRFWRITFKGYVTVTTISRDEETGGYRFDTVDMPRKDVPIEAIPNTGNSHGFTIDKIGVHHPFRESENGFSAIDLNLWLESNDINDALALKWDGLSGLEPKHILLLAGIGIAALVIWYVMSGGF